MADLLFPAHHDVHDVLAASYCQEAQHWPDWRGAQGQEWMAVASLPAPRQARIMAVPPPPPPLEMAPLTQPAPALPPLPGRLARGLMPKPTTENQSHGRHQARAYDDGRSVPLRPQGLRNGGEQQAKGAVAGPVQQTSPEHVPQAGGEIVSRQDVCHLSGPLFCKMLVSGCMAGAIIGRNGTMIGEIELACGCQLQLSTSEQYFPGTLDRICIIGGTLQSLERAISMVIGKVAKENKPLMVKLVVPSSSVSSLIGLGGETMKELSRHTKCAISVSRRVNGINERMVLISGEPASVIEGTTTVARKIQADPHIKEHLEIAYSLELPLGAWASSSGAPKNPDVPLISPKDADNYDKRHLVEYLQQAAPREWLLRHALSGSLKNIMKSNGHALLKDLVREIWELRCGELRENGELVELVVSQTSGQAPMVPSLVQRPLEPGLQSTASPSRHGPAEGSSSSSSGTVTQAAMPAVGLASLTLQTIHGRGSLRRQTTSLVAFVGAMDGSDESSGRVCGMYHAEEEEQEEQPWPVLEAAMGMFSLLKTEGPTPVAQSQQLVTQDNRKCTRAGTCPCIMEKFLMPTNT